MLRMFCLFLLITLTLPVARADSARITHACQPDNIATTAGYRTGFREKNALNRLVFLVLSDGKVMVKADHSPDSEPEFFAVHDASQALANAFHLNPDTLRFMASSPEGYLTKTPSAHPWLIVGKCVKN